MEIKEESIMNNLNNNHKQWNIAFVYTYPLWSSDIRFGGHQKIKRKLEFMKGFK